MMYQRGCAFQFSLFLLSLMSHVEAGPVNDTFTVNCQILTRQQSDPIVSPGVLANHAHLVVGGNAFSRSMGPADALGATGTTCDKNIDRSNYWIPQLYHIRSDGMYEMVPISGSATYYQNRACDYTPGKTYCDRSKVALAFKDGFRMIAGDTDRRTFNQSDPAQQAITYMCDSKGQTNTFPTQHCNMLRAQIYFPSCWTGGDVAPPDHTSHVTYPIQGFDGGMCPQSHPVSILSVFFEFGFDTSKYTDYNKFVWANGDTTGYGLHGDFINGWTDLNALQDAFATCSGEFSVDDPGCSITHGDKAKNSPSQQTLMHPATYEEDIGLNGPIAKLASKNAAGQPPPPVSAAGVSSQPAMSQTTVSAASQSAISTASESTDSPIGGQPSRSAGGQPITSAASQSAASTASTSTGHSRSHTKQSGSCDSL